MLVLGFDDYEAQGRRLADALACPFEKADLHHFPDGESRVRLPAKLSKQLIICRTLNSPNSKLIELLLAAETAREQGVDQITLVAPYLCYMRQDIAFHSGEAVSQRIIGRFFARLFDGVITTDAHLHRISQLSQAIPGIKAVNISATPLMTGFLIDRSPDLLLVGPDSESAQWVQTIATDAGIPWLVAKKKRLGDRQVEITLPPGDYAGKKIILIDDVISTGDTLITIAQQLKQQDVVSIDALVTHALFDESAANKMQNAGIENIWSTDSITHPSNILFLGQSLAEAVLIDGHNP
ncbi:MAG: ribose-phosphate diphosphokinase [Gammaproteobacteria bacterium]|nr:ribose-phosphate diphosphokinase [Gammaproteobacteria bacterium]